MNETIADNASLSAAERLFNEVHSFDTARKRLEAATEDYKNRLAHLNVVTGFVPNEKHKSPVIDPNGAWRTQAGALVWRETHVGRVLYQRFEGSLVLILTDDNHDGGPLYPCLFILGVRNEGAHG